MDQAIVAKFRQSVAKFLVEIDVIEKFPKEIWLRSKNFGYLENVEFENFPIFCSHDKTHCQFLFYCFIVHPRLRKKIVNHNKVIEKNKEPIKENEIYAPKVRML